MMKKHLHHNHHRHIKHNDLSKAEAMALVQKDAYALEDLSNEMKNDYEIVRAAVMQKPYAFGSASETLRNNMELALIAIKGKSNTIRYIGEQLKQNQQFWKEAYAVNKDVLEFLDNPRMKEEVLKAGKAHK